MSFDPARWRPAPLLPPGRGWLLVFVVAVLAFVAALSAVGARAALRASEGWSEALAGSASVLVRASGLESPDAAAARAAEALAGVPGVAEARALTEAQANALLSRFIDPKALPAGVWTPRLVAVDFKPGQTPRLADLRGALAAEGINGVVEDHAAWAGQARQAGALALWSAVGLTALMIAAVAAAAGFAARQGMEAWASLVAALRLCGATDRFVAGLVARRFAWLGLIGGVMGAAAAAGAAASLIRISPLGDIASFLPLRWADLAMAAPAPALACAAAAIAAALAARRTRGRA